jgi:hypothetical protein
MEDFVSEIGFHILGGNRLPAAIRPPVNDRGCEYGNPATSIPRTRGAGHSVPIELPGGFPVVVENERDVLQQRSGDLERLEPRPQRPQRVAHRLGDQFRRTERPFGMGSVLESGGQVNFYCDAELGGQVVAGRLV